MALNLRLHEIFWVLRIENTIRIIGKLYIKNKTLESGKLVKRTK